MITPRYSDDSIPYLHLVEMGRADYLHVHCWSSSSRIICMHVDGISLQNGPQHSKSVGCKFLLSVHLKNLDYVVLFWELSIYTD